MARPKKTEQAKLKETIRIPVTAEQKEIITRAAGEATSDGVAAWARKILLDVALGSSPKE